MSGTHRDEAGVRPRLGEIRPGSGSPAWSQGPRRFRYGIRLQPLCEVQGPREWKAGTRAGLGQQGPKPLKGLGPEGKMTSQWKQPSLEPGTQKAQGWDRATATM